MHLNFSGRKRVPSTFVFVCQAEEAIVVESAKMQFSGRPAMVKSVEPQLQRQVAADNAIQVNDIAASQQSHRANR